MLTRGVSGLDAVRALELSRKLGEWPFALELARAMIRQRMEQGDSAGRAVDRLLQILNRKGPRGLVKGVGDLKHRDIDGVLEGSLELLSIDDRLHLQELSIFPEEVAIPLNAAAAVWRLDELEAEETAQRLARLFLVKLDLGRGTMRLHDLMRGWLAAVVGDTAELHSRLVDAWPDWMNLVGAYAWRWLPLHLAEAKRRTDLELILWNPVWLQRKLVATDVNALIGDFEHLKPAQEVALIQGAIRLSSHILAKDPLQLKPQLVGRLLSHNGHPAVRRFSDSIRRASDHPWLRPLFPALDPPGTALLRTLVGHSKSVTGVALSWDGRRAVSASVDHTLKVWDLETGAEVRTLTGHSKSVTGVTLTPDGRRAVSGSYDQTLKVWDLETGVEVRTLTGHSNWVTGVALSWDGRRAVSASADRTLKVWDLATGVELHTLTGHSNGVTGVALTPDGRLAVSASWDELLKVWDTETGAELYSLPGHSEPVAAVALSRDGRRAVSASYDKTIKV